MGSRFMVLVAYKDGFDVKDVCYVFDAHTAAEAVIRAMEAFAALKQGRILTEIKVRPMEN